MSKSEADVALRVFLAIEIPRTIQAELGKVIASFDPYRGSLKLVDPALLHVTVRFLGRTQAQQVVEVEAAAYESAAPVPPFDLTLSGLGAFPSEAAPRVIWAGLRDDAGLAHLRSMARHLEDALAARGFPKGDRPLSPHITLARTRDTISAAQRHEIAGALHRAHASAFPTASFPVRDLIVMRSDLLPGGPRYTRIAAAPLGASLYLS